MVEHINFQLLIQIYYFDWLLKNIISIFEILDIIKIYRGKGHLRVNSFYQYRVPFDW